MLVKSRLYVRKVDNGYIVEVNTDDYNNPNRDETYIFTDWSDALNFIKDNQPRYYETLDTKELIALD